MKLKVLGVGNNVRLANAETGEAVECVEALTIRMTHDGVRVVVEFGEIDVEITKQPEANHEVCQVPPLGWWCSREPGHDGPCAARPM